VSTESRCSVMVLLWDGQSHLFGRRLHYFRRTVKVFLRPDDNLGIPTLRIHVSDFKYPFVHSEIKVRHAAGSTTKGSISDQANH